MSWQADRGNQQCSGFGSDTYVARMHTLQGSCCAQQSAEQFRCQRHSVFLLLQMRDLDTGSCWYESDVPQALGVSDIFDADHSKF